MDATPLTTHSDRSEPNLELLRRYGYAVSSCHGPYCTAFRGNEEIVVVWTADGWQRVPDGGRLTVV